MTEKVMTETKTMTLRELLEKDGYGPGSDEGIVVYDRGSVMAVSHRYLCGGWNEVLDSNAERVFKGRYMIIKEDK